MELYLTTRSDWRKWLTKNHLKEKEVWLRYYKKGSGKPRIPYDHAVEEALCFGWIDGKIRSTNEDYYIQRFTPRRKGSRWSKYNIERVGRMLSEGKMMKEGLNAYQDLLDNPSLAVEDSSDGPPVLPENLLKALENNGNALENFNSFPESARRIYVEWLKSAKQEATIVRRINVIVDRSLKKLKPGMM
jgi:uncharacterized protein YdeI (YjbR/CyaY-like superfamily)